MSLSPETLANLATRIDLRKAAVLLVEASSQGMDVLAQVFSGFGAKALLRASSFEEAKEIAHREVLDLVVCEAALKPGEADGYEFAHWLRRSGLEPNAFAPMIVLSSHTSRRNVVRARDCGAHFVVSKPLVPAILLERILWIARTNRIFVNCDSYIGPDRRFQMLGPPADMEGRRSTDLVGELGAARDPNMAQDEIDNLMRPQRVAL
ncbi:response regulator [Phenylobacterium sp.]|uniref:response regulator n=1 Tax=Phenylobacterium sp. TaxID=1871053 RepID=UPI0025F1D25E|nr:response regulator [Phenylobacterium sp.]